MKKISLLLFTVVTIMSYGQTAVLEKNISYNAKNLQFVQELNESQDTLFLQCIKDKKISQVDFMSDDIFETVKVRKNEIKLPLDQLPGGDYIVQAKIENHWIVMFLQKFDEQTEIPIDRDSWLTQNGNPKSLYFVVHERNSGFGSNRTMGLKYRDEVKRLISQTELERRSKPGKNNKLEVYEVYNTYEFMGKQLKNHTYYQSGDSEFFNVEPLYDSRAVVASIDQE
ncbi:MAG: hypothetical protein HRU26_12700 [Psychroserpens sp.]|nr:hypothetical protein [Psychroserpens sp.]